MKIQILNFGIFTMLLLAFSSCKSDEQRINDAKKTVELFIKDLELKNQSAIKKTYPDFDKIGGYWILSDFKINNSKIEGDKITIYGNYKRGNKFEEPIMFVLKEMGDSYTIIKSKGISAYFDSDIYNFLVTLGCLTDDSDDVEVQRECLKREYTYESAIESLKSEIESKIEISNSNLSSNYGYYVSGNLLVTNNSDFEIPSSAYSIYIGFVNSRTRMGVDKQIVSGFKPTISPHQTVSIPVSYVPINGGNKFGGLLNITNTSSLKKVFNQTVSNLNWDCSKIDEFSGFSNSQF